MNTTPEQYKRARELFKNMQEHERKGRALAWELLSHPDATPEQLQTAHRMANQTRMALERLVTALRHKWPERNAYFTQHPWHNPAYDRYNRPSLLKEMTNATAKQVRTSTDRPTQSEGRAAPAPSTDAQLRQLAQAPIPERGTAAP